MLPDPKGQKILVCSLLALVIRRGYVGVPACKYVKLRGLFRDSGIGDRAVQRGGVIGPAHSPFKRDRGVGVLSRKPTRLDRDRGVRITMRHSRS